MPPLQGLEFVYGDVTQGVARRLALPWAIIFRAVSPWNGRAGNAGRSVHGQFSDTLGRLHLLPTQEGGDGRGEEALIGEATGYHSELV